MNERKSFLCIESGSIGWTLIDYQEIYQSACEYLGEDRVGKIIVENRNNYLSFVYAGIKNFSPTHYFFDPRTGSQKFFPAIYQTFLLSVLLSWKRIIPIVWLTDMPVRRWRLQGAMLTAVSGIALTLMSSRQRAGMFLHQRLVGPCMMPFSIKKVDDLYESKKSVLKNSKPRAVFTGSLYEPRTTILNKIRAGLQKGNLDLEILARELGGKRVSDEEYWNRLLQADIIVTTSEQLSGPGIDRIVSPHLIYRYTEALAAGSLLIAPEVKGISRFFTPGEHFISYKSVDDAVEKISYYLNHQKECGEIANKGNEHIRNLIHAKIYWNMINSALTINPLI